MKARNPQTGNLEDVYVKALDSMPVGTQVEYTGSTIPVGWEEVNDYSTSEVNTGKKWIDGKTIYRKTFTGTRTGTATNIGSISNLDIITNAYGVATNSAGTLQQPIGYFDGANYVTLIKTTSGSINLYTADGLNGTYYITVEYTKSS